MAPVRSLVVILAVILTHAGPVAGGSLGSLEVPEVVVSATRSEHSLVTTPAQISVISRREIEASGATHLAQVLSGRGGVQLADLYGDGTRTSVSLRGFGANAAANTLILVDGRRLNNTDLAAPELSSIPVGEVERIEIIEGSAGTLFGDQAVGGVVNIITRRPQRFAANVQGSAGSYQQRVLRGALSDRLDNGFAFRLSGERRLSDGYRDNSALRYGQSLVNLSYGYDSGEIFLEHEEVAEDLRTPGGIFADELAADRRQTRFPKDFSAGGTHVSRLGIRQALGSKFQLEAEVTERRAGADGVLSGIAFAQDRHHRSLTPRLVGDLPMPAGDLILTLGADLDRTDYRLASPFGVTDNFQQMWGIYLQAVVPVGSGLSVTAGLRRAGVHNRLFDRPVFGTGFPNGVALDDKQWVRELGLVVRPDEAWRLFVRRDESLRFPLADEQTQTVPGVTGLRTQTGVSYEMGTDWRHGSSRLEATAYRLDLRDEIDFDPAAGPFGANTNLGATRRDGLILSGTQALGSASSISADYSYVDARFDAGSLRGRAIPFVAAHTLRLAGEYRPPGPWGIFAEWQVISRRVASGDYAGALARLPGYGVVNLHADREQGPWSLSVRVNNLMGKRYSEYAARAFNPATSVSETGYYPAPERNIMLTLGYRTP